MAFDIVAARKAGIADTDIISALSDKHSYDLTGARKAGVPDDEILSSLVSREGVGSRPVSTVEKVQNFARPLMERMSAPAAPPPSMNPAALSPPDFEQGQPAPAVTMPVAVPQGPLGRTLTFLRKPAEEIIGMAENFANQASQLGGMMLAAPNVAGSVLGELTTAIVEERMPSLQKASDAIQRNLAMTTYQPVTEAGQRQAEATSRVLTGIPRAIDVLDEAHGDAFKRNFPNTYAATQVVGEFAPFIAAGELASGAPTKFWNKVEGSDWYRKATIKERGLVVQDIAKVYDSLKEQGMSESEIARKDPAFFQEALKRRANTEKPVTEVKPQEEVIPDGEKRQQETSSTEDSQNAEDAKHEVEVADAAKADRIAKAKEAAAARRAQANSPEEGTRTVANYDVETEDSGVVKAKVMRHQDGSVTIFDDGATIEHNKDFAANKTDEELLKYDYEPIGYKGAKVSDSEPGKGSETPAEPADNVSEQLPAVSLRPAIKTETGVLEGKEGGTHPDIIKEHDLTESDQTERGFVTSEGRYLDRSAAKTYMAVQNPDLYDAWVETNGEGAKGELHSQDLNAAVEKVDSGVNGSPFDRTLDKMDTWRRVDSAVERSAKDRDAIVKNLEKEDQRLRKEGKLQGPFGFTEADIDNAVESHFADKAEKKASSKEERELMKRAESLSKDEGKIRDLWHSMTSIKGQMEGVASERGMYGVKWAEKNVSSRWSSLSKQYREAKEKLLSAVKMVPEKSAVQQPEAGDGGKGTVEVPVDLSNTGKGAKRAKKGKQDEVSNMPSPENVVDGASIPVSKLPGDSAGAAESAVVTGKEAERFVYRPNFDGTMEEMLQNPTSKDIDSYLKTVKKDRRTNGFLNPEESLLRWTEDTGGNLYFADSNKFIHKQMLPDGKIEAKRGTVYTSAEAISLLKVPVSPADEPVSIQAADMPEGYTLPAEYTAESHRDLLMSLRNGEPVEVDTVKQAYKSLLGNKEPIIAELTKLKKDDLLKQMGQMGQHRYKNEKKEMIVKAMYRDMVTDFAYMDGNDSLTSGMNDKISDVVQKKVDALTPEKLKAYAEKQAATKAAYIERMAGMVKAIKDPETLEDFQTLLRAKKDTGKTFAEARMSMTPEQREKYDDLAATETRERRTSQKNERKTEVRAAGQTTDGEVIETKHTKTGEPLFVVKAADRVDREIYNEWNATAKRLGGYYSSFRGNDAVPGFQFKERASADAFQKFLGGDVAEAKEKLQERRDAFVDDRSQTATERLNEMADTLEERAQESLGRDRKANTQKRAGDAARAEGQARREIATAETMRNIAKNIENGSAKFLDQVRTKAQVEMLDSFIKTGQDKAIREETDGSYLDYQKKQGRAMEKADADHVEFPNYTAFRSDLARLGREMEEIDGTKKLGAQLTKVANDVTAAYLKFAEKNLHKVSTFGKKNSSTGEVTGYATFSTRDAALSAINSSGYKGKATVVSFKKGEHLVVMGPEMAKEAGLWEGDDDKRISLTPEFAEQILAKNKTVGRRNRMSVPWTFDAAYEKRTRLASMGIETAPELRAALREYVEVKEPPKQADKIKEMERAMVGRKNDGMDFFPTPAGVSKEMIETADIQDGMTVLEPSAGMGHIADQIREAGHEPDVVEMSNDRKELLEAKGYNVVGRDFMDVTDKYDRIIINPPFSDRRDAQHVQHAFTLLNPGGRVVAIMGEGVFFGQDKKAVAFREWLDEVGGTSEKLEAGTFLDPSLPVNTGVNARMVVIDGPGEYTPRTEPDPTEVEGIAIGREWDSPYGRQRLVKIDNDGPSTMYTAETISDGTIRNYMDIEKTIQRNEYELTDEYAAEKADRENQAAVLKARKEEEATGEKALVSGIKVFTDAVGMNDMAAGKARESLKKLVKYKDQAVTIKEAVEQLVEAGELATTEQHDKVKPMTRTQFNRATQKEQDAHEKRVKEAGKKTVYYVGDFDLGKTAYDYAQYLIEKGPTVKESLTVPEDILIDAGLLQQHFQHADRWLYKFSPKSNWMTANSKEGAIEQATLAYNKLPESERLTKEQRIEKDTAEQDKVLERRYGHLNNYSLEKKLAELDGEIASLRKAGEREFNGNGGRRTSAAVSNEGARAAAQEKMDIERYLKNRKESDLPSTVSAETATVPETVPAKPMKMDGTTRPEKAAKEPLPGFSAMPEATQTKFNAAWTERDIPKLKEYLGLDNKNLRAEFENRTGEKLPKTVKGTDATIEEYFTRANLDEVTETVDVPFSPEQAIKVAADDVYALRASDVYRVLDEAGSDHRYEVAQYITKNHAGNQAILDAVRRARTELDLEKPVAPTEKELEAQRNDEPKDYTIAAQKPGMTKDDLKSVADVVQAFKDGKITYGKDVRNQRRYDQEGTDYGKLDKALADIPADAKISVAKDKVTITVKGEPLTEEQKAAKAEEAKALIEEASKWRKEAETLERDGFPGKTQEDGYSKKEIKDAANKIRFKADRQEAEASDILTAKNNDIKHVFYFEGDRIQQGKDAGGDWLNPGNVDKLVREARASMKALAGMDKAFRDNPVFKAMGTDKGAMLVYENGRHTLRLFPEAFGLSQPDKKFVPMSSPSGDKVVNPGDTVRLSPGYLENKTDEVYLIPKGGEGKVFYFSDSLKPGGEDETGKKSLYLQSNTEDNATRTDDAIKQIIIGEVGGKNEPGSIVLDRSATTRDMEKLAQVFGKRVIVFFHKTDDLQHIGGFFDPATSDLIFVNKKHSSPEMVIMGHEMVHALRNDAPDIYQDLYENVVLSDEGYQISMEGADRVYGKKATEDKAIEEGIADYVSTRFADPLFWKDLAKKRPSIFKKLVSITRAIIDRILKSDLWAKGADTWVKDLEKAKKTVTAAMSEYAFRKGSSPKEMFSGEIKRFADSLNRIFKDNTGMIGNIKGERLRQYNEILDKVDAAIEAENLAAVDKYMAQLDEMEQLYAVRELPEETTGIKNRMVDAEREAEGKDEAERLTITDASRHEEGKRLVDSGEYDPRLGAQNIIKDPKRHVSAEEQAALLYDKVRIKNAAKNIRDAIVVAMEAGDEPRAMAARQTLRLLEDDYDKNQRATKFAGTEASASLRIRVGEMKADYSIIHTVSRIRAEITAIDPETGKIEVPEEVRLKVEELTKQLETALDKQTEYEEKIKELEATRRVRKVVEELAPQRVNKRTSTRREMDTEFKSLSTRLRSILDPSKLNINFDPEAVVVLAEMARNRVIAGITDAKEIVDDIYMELSDIPDMDKRDIRDAISGYGHSFKMTQEEISVALREARSQMRLISALEDAESGELPLHSGLQRDPPTDEVRELQRQIRDAMRESGLDSQSTRSPEQQWKTALDSVKTRLNNEIRDLGKQISAGKRTKKERKVFDYDEEATKLKTIRDEKKALLDEIDAKPPKTEAELEKIHLRAYKSRTATRILDMERQLKTEDYEKKARRVLKMDAEAMRLKNEAEKLKDLIDREVYRIKQANRTGLERSLDLMYKLRRLVILSGTTTLGKLTAAATGRQISTIAEEGVASVLSRMPYLSRVAEQSPRYSGGLSVRAEAAAITEWFKKRAWQDTWEVAKTGNGELDRLYGHKRYLPPELIEIFGRWHGALKNMAKRSEFFRSLQKITEWHLANGYNVADPATVEMIAGLAYVEAQRAILMQDNVVVSAYKAGLATLRHHGSAGKITSGMLNILLPIVKIPTNWAAEVTSYVAGGPKALGTFIFAGGFKNKGKVGPDVADAIMRALVKQGVGMAIFMLGYYFSDEIGGFWEPGEKRKTTDVKAGGMRVYGVNIPRWALHTPALEMLQIGATVARTEKHFVEKAEKHPEKEQGSPYKESALATVRGVVEAVPFFEQPLRVAGSIRSTDNLSKWSNEMVESLLVPPDLRKVSKGMDQAGDMQIPRKADTLTELLRADIPGQRAKMELDMKKVKKMQLDQMAVLMENAPDDVIQQIRPEFSKKYVSQASKIPKEERDRYRDILRDSR